MLIQFIKKIKNNVVIKDIDQGTPTNRPRTLWWGFEPRSFQLGIALAVTEKKHIFKWIAMLHFINLNFFLHNHF